MYQWNFPDYEFGRRIGISDSGIETFTGQKYLHLAKEVCQNSLDAIYDTNKPVQVDFSLFEIDAKDFPNYEGFKAIMKACLKNSRQDEKAENFFTQAIETLEQKTIQILRISDYNTTGLTGSNKGEESSWNVLLHSTGESNKKGVAGGSYGIGKYATFACSDLRTVFYDTFDENKISAALGVAELTNFFTSEGKEKSGIGFYSSGTEDEPIFLNQSFDKNYNRKKAFGTDIYIFGFINEKEWKNDLIHSVLDGFLLAIFEEKLVVTVEGTSINKKTLADLFNSEKSGLNFNKSTSHEFYQCLTSSESKTFIDKNFSGMGLVSLTVLIDKNLKSRKVLMSRISGMKIFEMSRISGSIPFAGICKLEGIEVNKFFRKMESPDHTKWAAEYYSTKQAKKNYAEKVRLQLGRMIRDTVNEEGKKTSLAEVDVIGLGEYLPDISADNLHSLENKQEILTDDKADMEINIKDFEYNQTNQGVSDGITIDEGEYDYKESDFSGASGIAGSGSSDTPNEFLTEGEGNYLILKKKYQKFGDVRTFFNKEKKQNELFLKTNKTYENAELEILYVGEGNNVYPAVLKLAKLNNKTRLKISNNRILIKRIERNEVVQIQFKTNSVNRLAMEVNLYAN